MVLLRATRRLLKGSEALLDGGPPPAVGALGTWYANVISLPSPGRSLVLFTAADTLVSVVASGRSLRPTLPVFQRRTPLLLRRLGVPDVWGQAHADAMADVHVARAGSLTVDRRVLGTMIDSTVQVRAEAQAAGAFDRLDLDGLEDRLAEVPLGAIGYRCPAEALADLVAFRG